jgi:Cu/Ag efflux protein CusF
MTRMTAILIAGCVVLTQSLAQGVDAPRLAQAPATTEKAPATAEKMPAKSAMSVTKLQGTITAIDKDEGMVTVKGSRGNTVRFEVQDRQKLDMIKVGDPVVAAYVEAVAFRVQKAGTATPGTSVQESRVTSKPGETPAGAIGREITATGTITAIDRKAQTVTIQGPKGRTETIKAKDPKNLQAVKVGDLVEITYSQAFAISLDKPAAK